MIGVLPVSAAQYAFWDSSPVLKPVTSCSMPKTRTLFAFRAAGVRGTFAQACANGAAASLGAVATCIVALAVAPTESSATATPATSHSRLCIYSLRLVCAGSLYDRTAALAQLLRPEAFRYVVRRRRGSLVSFRQRCQRPLKRDDPAALAARVTVALEGGDEPGVDRRCGRGRRRGTDGRGAAVAGQELPQEERGAG